MSNEQQQIIDKVYESALIEYGFDSLPSTPAGTWFETIEHFIHKCKMDNEFYEKWGLKIEERELSNEEIAFEANKRGFNLKGMTISGKLLIDPKEVKKNNLPTKLVTITYNNETIESYD